jgi:hypothetical protein
MVEERQYDYNTILEYYGSFDCSILILEEELESHKQTDNLPYFCPEGHLIYNLTIEEFKFCIKDYGCCDVCNWIIINRKCKHNVRDYNCKKCPGKGICEHNRERSRCVSCNGSEICDHGKRRIRCVDCKGSQICEHDKVKEKCKKCKGSQICEHDKERYYCIICKPGNACPNCKSVCPDKRSRFHPFCFRCYCVLNPDADIPKRYKLKEHYLRNRLKELFDDKITLTFDKAIEGGCSKKRPDVFIHMGDYSIVIECDEDQHQKESYNCENKRLMQLFKDNGKIPLITIRFNPDSYTENGEKINGCFKFTKQGAVSIVQEEWDRRIKILKKRIKFHIKNRPEKEITYEELFYSTE